MRLKTVSTICLVLMIVWWIFIVLATPMRTYPVLAEFEVFPVHMFILGASILITTLVVLLLIRSLAGRIEAQDKILKRIEARMEIPKPPELTE